MFTYVWGWSRGQRLSAPRVLMAKDEATARRMIREQFNVRTTRGLSINVLSQDAHERERLNSMGNRYPTPQV